MRVVGLMKATALTLASMSTNRYQINMSHYRKMVVFFGLTLAWASAWLMV